MPKLVKVEGRIIRVPDDATPDEIDAIFTKQQPTANPRPVASFRAAPARWSTPWAKEKFYNAANSVGNALPAVGGTVGGILGTGAGVELGPGAIATGVGGAALGGAAGESARQLLRRALGSEVPATSTDAAKAIGIEAVKQGAMEAGGQLIGAAGRAVAPTMARTALRIPKAVDSRGVDTGRAILKLKGIRPQTIARNAETREAELGQALDRAVKKPNLPPVDLKRPISRVNEALAKTNNPNNIHDFDKLGGIIREDNLARLPGGRVSAPLKPLHATPEVALNLRRDIDDTITNWGPQLRPERVQSATKQAYGDITGGLHVAVPETVPIDNELSNLIPVRYYANRAANQRGIVENMLTPKGSSLTTAGAGLGFGVSHTPEGAFLGAVGGRIIPDALANPAVRIAAARTANSPITPQVVKGAARLATMPRSKEEPEEEEQQQY